MAGRRAPPGTRVMGQDTEKKWSLPETEVVDMMQPVPRWARVPRRGIRHRKRWIRSLITLFLAFIVFAQWKQMQMQTSQIAGASTLSIAQLRADLATCATLQSKPQDPVGLGRTRNARYIEGHRPTLIRNATVWVGEPDSSSTSTNAGYHWISADVLLERGIIIEVSSSISVDSLSSDTIVWDAAGRQLTSGIVDMHSHAGVYSLPTFRGNLDVNEGSADITPFVRSIDGLSPLDHQIQVIKSGGVTTSLVLPGSSNNIGGEAYVIKHAVGKPDGRDEISATDMLADPARTWRYMKMACGENPKRVHGILGEHGPLSRMGESWEFRHAFEQAAKLNRQQDDWCNQAANIGAENMESYLPQELRWEALGAVLRGQVHVNTHCYTIPDLEAFVDHTNEFQFPVRAFHHAHQSYLVPEILNRTYGGRAPAAALFIDNMYYKAESYVASEHAGRILWEAGLTPVYVSDNPVLNAQHLIFEAAKAYRHGLPYHVALASVTTAPAELIGLGQQIGKLKPGFDADIVVWDSDPLSVGATPVQVWIDGTAQFEDPVELVKPLGKPIVPNGRLGEIFRDISDEEFKAEDIIFTGVSKVLYGHEKQPNAAPESLNVAISKGKVACIGACEAEFQAAAASNNAIPIIPLNDGHITAAFTGIGASLGLNEIDSDPSTDNGPNPSKVFSRAVDGLALANKKLLVAHAFGITRAISAPKFTSQSTHHGTSVGFVTGAGNVLDEGAVWADDVAVHYTLTLSAKGGDTPSISSVIGQLRSALLAAVKDVHAKNAEDADAYAESSYLRKVVTGELPLAITVHSADTIGAILRVKASVEDAIASASPATSPKLRFVLIGGAEAHLVASELADAQVGVILSPFLSYASNWEERRALPGAPLSNGTAVDVLLNAGVATAIGLEEDWHIRDLGLLAGIAFKNGGGKISEQQALGLVSGNIYEMLGLAEREREAEAEKAHFVVWEGHPFQIDGRIRAVGAGLGSVSLF